MGAGFYQCFVDRMDPYGEVDTTMPVAPVADFVGALEHADVYLAGMQEQGFGMFNVVIDGVLRWRLIGYQVCADGEWDIVELEVYVEQVWEGQRED
jgi:hypothetical protein